jgi:hypothetical protein
MHEKKVNKAYCKLQSFLQWKCKHGIHQFSLLADTVYGSSRVVLSGQIVPHPTETASFLSRNKF